METDYLIDSNGYYVIEFVDSLLESHPVIPGLYYIPDFIDEDIADEINDIYISDSGVPEWEAVGSGSTSRKVVHYGYRYDYKTKRTNEPTNPMPLHIRKLRDLIISEVDTISKTKTLVLDQCIVNSYEPGQGIGPHIDHLDYGDVICCLTFGSGSTMVFASTEGGVGGINTVELNVQPRSLYVMSGDARYKWTHSQPSRKSDVVDGERVRRDKRVSITFRTLIKK